MSTAVSRTDAAAARRVPRSRLRGFWGSTIGLKIITAITGVILSLFILVHMLGNLQVFQGQEAIDAYARLLRAEPAVLWAFRLGLLAAVALHTWAFLVLWRRNREARATAYRVVQRKESTYASRTMKITGPLLLAFIVYHILHMTTGTVHADFHPGRVYQNLSVAFHSVPVAIIYLLAMAMLGFHLWHGIWSLFQTLGSYQPRFDSLGRHFATAFTLVVVLGFCLVPLAGLSGRLKLPAAEPTTVSAGQEPSGRPVPHP